MHTATLERPALVTFPGGQLVPRSPAARALLDDLEALAPTLRQRALDGDATGEFPRDSLDDLRRIGYLGLPAPVEAGGGGVGSTHDLVVVAERLARLDPSLAIGVNMHFVMVTGLTQAWQAARVEDPERGLALGAILAGVVAEGATIAAAVSEPPPQDLSRAATTATPVGGGWRVDGVKAFCTMSPAADLFNVAVTYVDEHGAERGGFALVPATAPGVIVHDDWDALGMRTSGSGRVTFDGVLLGPGTVSDSHPAGVASAPLLDRYLTSGLYHAAATLGIAESAQLHVTDPGRRDRVAADPQSVRLVGENAADLAAMRAVLARAADVADAHFAGERPPDQADATARSTAAFSEVQQAKVVVDRLGPVVVDRALAVSGGGGYLTSSPLAKAYRDVRAGPFMHPLGANRAARLIGQLAVGAEPDLS
jgi:alkylation response protein AidB-like acyl-CoA dehydrogenase